MANVSTKTTKRGKKPVLTSNVTASILAAAEAGTQPTVSRFHQKQMIAKGYAEFKAIVPPEGVIKRGRRPFEFVVTGKGRAFYKLIQSNQARAAEKAAKAAPVEVAQAA